MWYGHKRENVLKLKEVYDVDLILKQDKNIKQGKSKIEITKTYTNWDKWDRANLSHFLVILHKLPIFYQ